MTLRCFWIRRRIDVYLDGALQEGHARGVARHLDGCPRCRESARQHARLTALVQGLARPRSDPDWGGFWPGIRARLLAERSVAHRLPWSARSAWPLGWVPHLAVGSAVAGVLLLSLLLWRGDEHVTLAAPGIVVRALEVSNPHTSVMVFSPPGREVTVIWVFGLESSADQSLREPDGMSEGRHVQPPSVPS